jgi:hypothetical protein
MSSLFLLGNGFDIAHDIPTKYSDFRSFIINLYPEALGFRDEIVYMEDCDDIEVQEFAAEILLNAMDKAAGENWSDFEEALALVNFNRKLPLANHQENETDKEDNELMGQYLLYIDVLTSGFINCAKMWQDFFRLWIKDIQTQIDYGTFSGHESLKELFSQPNAKFLTFNYTKTLQALYGVKKVIHIHNRVGQKLIFGHGQDNATYTSYMEGETGPCLGSSFLDDMIMSFKKDTQSPLKKYNAFFKNLTVDVDKVYSYGFGYGRVDSVYIKRIISSISKDAIWHFTVSEAQHTNSLRVKKIKLRKWGFKGSFDTFEG